MIKKVDLKSGVKARFKDSVLKNQGYPEKMVFKSMDLSFDMAAGIFRAAIAEIQPNDTILVTGSPVKDIVSGTYYWVPIVYAENPAYMILGAFRFADEV